MNGPSIYAPEYLRLQKDTQLHGIADMIETQIKTMQYLREDIQKAVQYLREGKAKFAPETTNSLVDDLIAKYTPVSDSPVVEKQGDL